MTIHSWVLCMNYDDKLPFECVSVTIQAFIWYSMNKHTHYEPLVGPRYCFIEHWIIQKLRNMFHIKPSPHVLLILYSHWECYKWHKLYMALKLSLSHAWGQCSHPHFDIYHELNVPFTYSIKQSYNNNTRNIYNLPIIEGYLY